MILVLVDHDRGELDPLSLRAISAARKIDSDVQAVVIGESGAALAAIVGEHGVETLHVASHSELVDYAPAASGRSLEQLVNRIKPSAVLAAGSPRGNEQLAHLSAIMDLPMAAECSSITLSTSADSPHSVTRARWAANLLEDALVHSNLLIATVLAFSFEADPLANFTPAQVETFTPELSPADLAVKVLDRGGESSKGGVTLADAKVIVSGGRGVGGPAGFSALEELASLLEGTVGCSRVVTSAGWRPHAEQVGQTGTKVAPDLYIAAGISGAMQHIAGCKNSKTIVAINTDPEAPILAYADYAIIGDLHQVIPALTAAIKQVKGLSKVSDISIAQEAKMQPIGVVAARLGIDDAHLEPYGHYKAKISLSYLDSLPKRANSKLILVTAISPTPAGEGKTTTTVGLGDALRLIGKKAMICLREPSLGPVFGMKGGAAGGGYAQVVPMEDINLHFTGDFNAIALANNLLAALLDNHIHHGNILNIDVRRVTWKRVVDMNDRALRNIVVSLGGVSNGFPREDGFDIVVASEIMAIFCLATSLEDLKERMGKIVVAYTKDKQPVLASDLNAHGAMTVILKDAFQPNLVQTLENTPAFIHGGPFANIAHGCNSVVATTSAMKLADYVVTEAGFGADLGAEKFIDIKCRKSGLRPSACVLVATIRALKYHGGADLKTITEENLEALEKGVINLQKHVTNIQEVYGLPTVVAINHFSSDTDAEVQLLRTLVEPLGVKIVLARHWADGGAGATDLAEAVVELCDQPSQVTFVYPDEATLWEKINAVAKRIYGASEVTADSKIRNKIKELQESGYGHFPICVAKTQYSFSTDPALRGAPTGHSINIREVRLSAGAEFIVMVCGEIMTMPGLPKVPSSERIDYVDGKVVGLF